MNFDLDETIRVLFRTPAVFYAWLGEMPEERIRRNEGEETWSPFDILGHLIHGEKTDWMPRLRRIMSESEEPFEPFDRFAMLEASRGRTLQELLDEFRMLRLRNVQELREMELVASDLDREGVHPELGRVTAQQLLATWVTHDQAHIAQAARVLAKSYGEHVGPWSEYLSILKRG
ncbi:MAG: DinB family protein [Thermoanaerobaculia bacterium]|nr:DinB family protein [Thermoanaerobaculia bacterium]